MRTAIGEQLRHEVELAPDRRLVFGLDPRTDAELAPREAQDKRPSVADRAVLPVRHALVVEAQHEFALGEHVDVHEPPPLRPELLVEAPAEAFDLVARVRLGGK